MGLSFDEIAEQISRDRPRPGIDDRNNARRYNVSTRYTITKQACHEAFKSVLMIVDGAPGIESAICDPIAGTTNPRK
jgi:hypothetical protein